MTLTLALAQVQERLTVTLQTYNGASFPSAVIVVDGRAYTGLHIPATGDPKFIYALALERGPHIIYGQATDSAGTVTTSPITYVMAYELTEYGIDIYSGDAKLDVIEPVLHDELLPALPTLNFSCATLLTGTIQAVIRERGLRQYQFTVSTVAVSGGIYSYTCKAAESYALTTAIMALQTAYGATSDAIALVAPSLNIVNVNVPTYSTVNHIDNGNFETDITGWTGQDATLSLETGAPLVGVGSLKILNTANGGDAYCSSLKALTVGHQYMVTCFAKSTAGAGQLARLQTNSVYGMSIDCSTENLLTVIFTATATSLPIFAKLVSGITNEYLIIDSVVCQDLTDISNANLLAQTTYPQIFANITPTEIIKQFMIQSLAQASVRNGNLYVFPLDVSGQIPDHHMQRLDPLTVWQRDSDIYDAVEAHYIIKQYPTPDTVLTFDDAANWTGTVTDVTQVATTLLPVPSGALGMLHSNGNASRAGLSALFKNFDRIRFNWNPVTATTVLVSLQQDASNKLEFTHTFAGQTGAGFLLRGSPGVSTDTLTENITLSPVQYVTTVTGTTTAGCSYRVTLLNAAGATLWQDAWRSTIGNTFEADVPTSVSQSLQATKVRIEFTDLYAIDANYGVQCVTCDITVQTWGVVGTHIQVDSTITYPLTFQWMQGEYVYLYLASIPNAGGGQWYTYAINILNGALYGSDYRTGGFFYITAGDGTNHGVDCGGGTIIAILQETVTDYAWVSSYFTWSAAFNLFEAVNLALSDFTRTGNPTNLTQIVLTFADDNYVDSLVLVADNPLPVTVRAGTGSRAYVVTDDFGSEAGAQAYADGLLPIVSVPREQYTRDVPLSTDLSVGDTINGDGVDMTVYAIDYRENGKTLAAGRALDTLQSRLSEQSRQIDALKRKT